MTVPYSGCCSSALTDEGQTARRATKAKNAIERVEKRCLP